MASKPRIRQFGALIALALALLLMPAAEVFARAQSVTIHFDDVAAVNPNDVNPCTGDPGTTTVTYSGVLNVTQDAAGGTHASGTLIGSFFADSADPGLPDFSGRFIQWFGDNNTTSMDVSTFTFSVKATGTDGSTLTFHEVAHLTAQAIDFSTDPPTVTGARVSFDKARCG